MSNQNRKEISDLNLTPLIKGKAILAELKAQAEKVHNAKIDDEDYDEAVEIARQNILEHANNIATELESVNRGFTFEHMGIDCDGGVSAFGIYYGEAPLNWVQECNNGNCNLGVDLDGFYSKSDLLEHINNSEVA